MSTRSTSPVTSRTPRKGWAFNPLTHARRATLSFLQGLFAEFPPGQFHWSEGLESEISIGADAPVDLEKTGQRPAIVCGRSAMQFGKIAIDDFHSQDTLAGITKHADMLSMTLAVGCLADNDMVTDELAWICTRHMWILRKILQQSGFHEFGRGIRVEPATPAGALVRGTGKDDWKKTVVMVPTYFWYSDLIKPVSAVPLEGIIMHMTANTGYFQDVTPTSVGLVGTGIGRRLPDGGFEVPRQRQTPRGEVVWEKEEPAPREADLSITVEV